MYGICKYFSFLLTYWLDSTVLRRSHVMLLELCLCVVIFKATILKAQSHFPLTALPEHFFVTPLALQTRHLSCVSDRLGQCLLPQTLRLATRFSTFGGLPNGLVTLRSGPACASIFLKRVNRKSLWNFLTTTRGIQDVAIENGQV
jgi:hypothetical protein